MISYHKQQMLPLGQLNPAEYNPRQMPEAEMARLTRSLEEFGFVEPVVARKSDLLIIGGHQRVAALRQLLERQGLDEAAIAATQVPVILLDGITDERAKLLNLALNRISGEWDYPKLATVLGSFAGYDDLTKELSGFSAKEIEDICSLMGADLAIPPGDDGGGETEDVDAALNREARKFAFEVPSDEDAAFARATLQAFGMSGPRSAGDAFMKLVRAAAAQVPPATEGSEVP